MKPLADCKLYTFIDTAYLHGRAPELVAQQLCDGGSDLIQLRAKNTSPTEIRADGGKKILPITKRANVGLVINDHLDIAREIGADICHLGQEDFFDAGYTHISAKSEVQDPRSKTLIGLSTHAPEQAQRALVAGADYLAIGPVYATDTKPGAKPVTLEYVRWAAVPRSGMTVPWFAIGGINLENLGDVLAAGATRICVVSAILDAPDVAKACREFRQRLV